MKEVENTRREKINELIKKTLELVNEFKKNIINKYNALQDNKSKWGIQEQEFNHWEDI
tara:strand:+ start:861 stop:1034 length:174 start_codon:yes stop_codon:yes gene_type:complete